MNAKFQKFLKLIKSKERFLIGCHVNPDGDAIGSMLALGLSLAKIGKEVVMISLEVPSVFDYLDGIELVKTSLPSDFEPEVLIGVDCAEKDRLNLPPEVWEFSEMLLVNIDHHLTNLGFGDLNIIDPEASATGEIIYRLLQKSKWSIDKAIATALYTAIGTDTGFFRYANTSALTLEQAAKLVKKYMVEPAMIAEQVHEQKSYNSIRLLGEVLNTLKLENNDKVAWMVLNQKMLARFPVDLEETESYVSYARSLENVEIGILFKEVKPNEVKISWRSAALVDVSKLAGHFGGGGHARAAGCNLNGSIDVVIREVLDYVSSFMETIECGMES